MKPTTLLILLLVSVSLMVDIYTRQQLLQSVATVQNELEVLQGTTSASNGAVMDQVSRFRSIDRSISDVSSKLDAMDRRLDQLDSNVQANAP